MTTDRNFQRKVIYNDEDQFLHEWYEITVIVAISANMRSKFSTFCFAIIVHSQDFRSIIVNFFCLGLDDLNTTSHVAHGTLDTRTSDLE